MFKEVRRKIKMGLAFEDVMGYVSLFHSLLFAYQKASKEVLEVGYTLLADQVMNVLKELEKRGELKITGDNFEEAVKELYGNLKKIGLIENYSLDKIDEESFLFKIKGCVFAESS